MDSTGTRTGNRQTSEVDREWSEAALVDRAERAGAEAGETPDWQKPPAPMEAARPRPTPWRTIAVVGTFAVLPWLMLGGVAYLLYLLA